MATIVDELVTLLGFNISPNSEQTAGKYSKVIDGLATKATLAATAVVGVAASIAKLTQSSIRHTSGISVLSELTGTSAEALQRWGYAAERAGGSAQGVQNDIKNLMKSLNPVMPGQFNEGMMFFFGGQIPKFKNEMEMVLAISEKFKGMNVGQQLNWADQMGFGEEMVLLLRKSRKEILEYYNQATVVPDKTIKAARDFDSKLKGITLNIKAMGDTVLSGLAPGLTKVAENVERWMIANQPLLTNTIGPILEGITKGFGKFSETLSNFLPDIGKMTKGFTDVDKIAAGTNATLQLLAGTLAVIYRRFLIITAAIEYTIEMWKLFNRLREGETIEKAVSHGDTPMQSGLYNVSGKITKGIKDLDLEVPFEDLYRQLKRDYSKTDSSKRQDEEPALPVSENKMGWRLLDKLTKIADETVKNGDAISKLGDALTPIDFATQGRIDYKGGINQTNNTTINVSAKDATFKELRDQGNAAQKAWEEGIRGASGGKHSGGVIGVRAN